MVDNENTEKSFSDKVSAAFAEYPVRVRLYAGIVATIIVTVLVQVGIPLNEAEETVANFATLGVDLIILVSAIKAAENKVTPMSNPKTDDGIPLVPIEPEPHAEVVEDTPGHLEVPIEVQD